VTTDCANWWRRGLWLAAAGTVVGLAIVLASPARSATFPELYTVSVEQDSGERINRAEGVRRGMALLLTRITGRRQVADYPEMTALIENAQRYLDSYESSGAEIRVGFRRSEVNEALTQTSLPIWGDERPSTLLWLTVDLGGGLRAELKAGDDTARRRPGVPTGVASSPLPPTEQALFDGIAEEILSAADERGLPLLLPRLDAFDLGNLQFADVFGGYENYVRRAAEPYAADDILIGQVTVTDFGTVANWTLLRGEQRQTRTAADPRAGIDWLADEFATEYAVIGGARLTRITIRDIATWPDFGRVLDYLASLSIVESVDVESLARGDLLLRLAVRGDDSQLRQYLTLDGVLQSPQRDDRIGLVFVPAWLARSGALGGL
jgi:hypothetical protein